MKTELIENLHLLSVDAIDLSLAKININKIIHKQESYSFLDFLDRDSYVYQCNLIDAEKNKIDVILNNFEKAIDSNCNNNIDLSNYSIEDKFGFSYRTIESEKKLSKRYLIKEITPNNEVLFKELWLFNFIEELKKITWIVRDVLNKPQPKKEPQLKEATKPNEVKKELRDFIDNVVDKQKFIQDLKKLFPTEKGKTIKAIIKILIKNKIINILDRQFKEFYNCLKKDFNRNIGTYASVNDVKEFDNIFIEKIETKLNPFIIKHKTN